MRHMEEGRVGSDEHSGERRTPTAELSVTFSVCVGVR